MLSLMLLQNACFCPLGDPGFTGLSFFHSEVSMRHLWGPCSVEAKIDICGRKKNFQMGQCRKGSPTVLKNGQILVLSDTVTRPLGLTQLGGLSCNSHLSSVKIQQTDHSGALSGCPEQTERLHNSAFFYWTKFRASSFQSEISPSHLTHGEERNHCPQPKWLEYLGGCSWWGILWGCLIHSCVSDILIWEDMQSDQKSHN